MRTRIRSLVVASCTLPLSLGLLATEAFGATPYYFTNENSGLALDVNVDADPLDLQQKAESNDVNERFELVRYGQPGNSGSNAYCDVTNVYFQIQSDSENLVVAVANDDNQTPLALVDRIYDSVLEDGDVDGTDAPYSSAVQRQLWMLAPLSAGEYQIVNVATGFAFDVTNRSLSSGAVIQAYTAEDEAAQLWTLRPRLQRLQSTHDASRIMARKLAARFS